MSVELDHVIIFCAEGAPEAEALVRLGFAEGSRNVHPGQGTANRRFFFDNAFLEMVWVADMREARSDAVRRTQLWERWSGRQTDACPFGLVFRPGNEAPDAPPFPSWPYRPAYLPPELAIDVAESPLNEPAYFHLGFARRGRPTNDQPRAHAAGVERITGVTIDSPVTGMRSTATQAIEDTGLLSIRPGTQWQMQITFDRARTGGHANLQPELPLVLDW